jgi:hypothetical protein
MTRWRVAGLWVELMARLGYPRFAAHANDIGAVITGPIALDHPERLIAFHTSAVDGEGEPLAAQALDGPRHLPERSLVPVQYRDVGALAGQAERARPADAAGRAGDHRNPT